jgi:hypothetical protein
LATTETGLDSWYGRLSIFTAVHVKGLDSKGMMESATEAI